MISVLDQGYVKHITTWGSDQLVIESARMSTDKGFEGWGDGSTKCSKCMKTFPPYSAVPVTVEFEHTDCGGKLEPVRGDEKLLAYLYNNKHMTPFEMAGLTIEVKAPLFVFREWHRHRTQGYSEMSARYVPLPDENYMPTIERIKAGAQAAGANRQAQGAVALADDSNLAYWLEHVSMVYDSIEQVYQEGIAFGVPKEVARIIVPVGRYSRMRATANLRNWLQFLQLRDTKHAPGAQWEIRQFADAVGKLIEEAFPRTYALFNE